MAYPPTITLKGRLSFPALTMEDAIALNDRSTYPVTPDRVKPSFNLLIDQDTLDQLVAFLEDEFLPFCGMQFKANESKNALEPKHVKRLATSLKERDWENQPPYLAIKPVPEKTQEMAPDAVASIKVTGFPGKDILERAVVHGPEEVADAFQDEVSKYPTAIEIGMTTHSLYAGCVAAATLSPYAYVSGSLPGISLSTNVLFFKEDAEQFGSDDGIVDEDALFDL